MPTRLQLLALRRPASASRGDSGSLSRRPPPGSVCFYEPYPHPTPPPLSPEIGMCLELSAGSDWPVRGRVCSVELVPPLPPICVVSISATTPPPRLPGPPWPGSLPPSFPYPAVVPTGRERRAVALSDARTESPEAAASGRHAGREAAADRGSGRAARCAVPGRVFRRRRAPRPSRPGPAQPTGDPSRVGLGEQWAHMTSA